MMMNLFLVFDPTSYFGLSINWLIIYMLFLYFPLKYYLVSGGIKSFFKNVFVKLKNTFKNVSLFNHLGMSVMCVMTFLYLMFSNLLGLFPFIFTSTAHLLITLGLGLVLWLSFFLMGVIKNFEASCAHLVPEGSPLFLSPFMVIIESISHLIRPFTLSVRLAANMMAGHLIVGLLSSISMINYWGFFESFILQNILLLLEFGVAIIQGFVFSILLLLYALEYY